MTMNRHKGLSRPQLWLRIAGAHLPVERDGRGFGDHLGEITGLSPMGGQALEAEYRRFLYLAVLAPGARVPPGLVRIAWSFHADHEGYAREFSQHVLGYRLAFSPSVVAPAGAYAATVRAYRYEFGAAPPSAIWPDPRAPASLPMWHGAGSAPAPLHA